MGMEERLNKLFGSDQCQSCDIRYKCESMVRARVGKGPDKAKADRILEELGDFWDSRYLANLELRLEVSDVLSLITSRAVNEDPTLLLSTLSGSNVLIKTIVDAVRIGYYFGWKKHKEVGELEQLCGGK